MYHREGHQLNSCFEKNTADFPLAIGDIEACVLCSRLNIAAVITIFTESDWEEQQVDRSVMASPSQVWEKYLKVQNALASQDTMPAYAV